LGLGEDDVELPPACETAEVAFVEECDDTPPEDADTDVEYPDPCQQWWRIDGIRYDYSGLVHGEEVEMAAGEWFLVDGTDGVDRLARGEVDTFMHLIGEGWLRMDRM
jgi:hypothetical protein